VTESAPPYSLFAIKMRYTYPAQPFCLFASGAF